MKERHIATGKVYYETGELYFEGRYYTDAWKSEEPWKPEELIEGIAYGKNGNKRLEGRFQHNSLLMGKAYDEQGVLKFDGIYNDKYNMLDNVVDEQLFDEYLAFCKQYNLIGHPNLSYDGPLFPICGKFYDDDGKLIFDGIPRLIYDTGKKSPNSSAPRVYGILDPAESRCSRESDKNFGTT